MLEAFIVYFSLLLLLLLLALKREFVFANRSLYYNINSYQLISLISILLFSLIIGLRYYVGGDYGVYLDSYNYLNVKGPVNDSKYEFGFYGLMFTLKSFGLSYPFLFISASLLQIFFIYKWGSHYKFLLPWVIYFYFTTLYLFESMNIIRQAIAFSLILYSIIYISKSNYIKFIITVLLAFSIHKSAIFFLPFYFFVEKDWIKNKYIQISVLILFFAFSNLIIQPFFKSIVPVANLLNYVGYSEQRADLFLENNINSLGLGIYFILIIDCILLYYSDKLKKVFRNYPYVAYNNMFFIGALLSSIASKSNSITISRSIFYFVSFRLIVLSFLCYYLFSISKSIFSKIVGFSIVSLFLIWFISGILRGAAWCSPYQFIFQDYVPLR